MKMIKTGAVFALVTLIAVFAGCKNNETPAAETTTVMTEYDMSQAVNAFNPITEKDEPETDFAEITTKVFEKITERFETSTRKNLFQEKETEKTTVTTAAKPTTTKLMTTTAVPTAKQTVKVTVNEGDSLTQIFKKLDENGVADFDALMETAQSYDYSYYPLVAEIPSNPNRCFRLEGYLFPDTYEFYLNQKPQDAIGKFLRNGKAKITDSMKSQASSLGYSMYEILTVASIIEKEGAKSSEVSKIAAVIYNRLEAGMKLQMDSTIYYIERHVKPYLSGDINRYNSHYNTYKCSALPAGPISNPGMRTINAALNPADVDYLYFCHDENANYYYAETFEEHQENLKKAGLS
ncbi:MAG: endolytic transglycosylase MltG [Clostridia bacterium]|nr:endolytic transglycosylase MltG [Clostridia bacterium]